MARINVSIIKSIRPYMGSSWETRYLCVLSFARKHTLYCYNFSIRAQSTFPMAVIPSTSILNNRNKAYYCLSYPSYFGSKGAKDHESESILPSASGTGVPHTDDWVHMFNDSFQYLNHTLDSAYEKIKEIVEETSPHVNRLIQSHPYLGNVIAPIGCTLTATVLAWVVMPRVLRRVHKYTTQSPAVLLSKGFLWEQVPYERSMWAALEEPVRYLITFMAFSQIGEMVAPSTLASEYISKSWRGAVVLSFVWFLYRWKTYVFSHALAFQSMEAREREKLQTLDKLSSVGLFVLGLMALSEACGVAVQSIITVGGIGGVATAFAARDILGNVLSGLSMQFSKPFSLGDTIKAGSIEGQVAEMGLMTTVLLNSDKHPVIVPNSLFSSQSKEERYSTEQDVLIKSAEIIKQHGARLGSIFPEGY